MVQDLKVQDLVKLVDGYKELVKSFALSYSIKYDTLYSLIMLFLWTLFLVFVLVLQRGTGLSTPLTSSSMLQFKSAKDLADYLVHFRADNIVKDAEFIRVRLVPNADPWTILGQVNMSLYCLLLVALHQFLSFDLLLVYFRLVFLQSFGGFCAVTYLSFAPEGLKQVLITGGIPPVGKACTADDVYEAGFEQVVRQNEKYYKRFPDDIEIVREIVNYLAESEGGGVRDYNVCQIH